MHIFLDKLGCSKSKNALQSSLRCVDYNRKYISRKAEKPNPFFEMRETEVPNDITSKLKDTFDSVKKALSDACELALKQPIPENQLDLMMDASLRCAGYPLMIEENFDQKKQSKRKTYAPVWFGSKSFSPAQLKICINSKKLLASFRTSLSLRFICGKQESQQLL